MSEPWTRFSIAYGPPDDVQYQDVYDLLRGGEFLDRRENFKPIVAICYEFLKRILENLPNQSNPDGVTLADAAVGQFFWVTLHEVGYATFDIFDVPGAADNFATYIMLQFGEGQAHRLIAGAAWAWRAYLGDYRKNPVVPLRLSAFGSDHGLPQESFYNLICLAFGADRVGLADLANYFASNAAPGLHIRIPDLGPGL